MIAMRRRIIRVVVLFWLALFAALCLSVITPPAREARQVERPGEELVRVAPQVALAQCDAGAGDPFEQNGNNALACEIADNAILYDQNIRISYSTASCTPPNGRLDDLDWFYLWLENGARVRVRIEGFPNPAGSDIRFFIWDSWQVVSGASSWGATVDTTYTSTFTGTYYLDIGNNGCYRPDNTGQLFDNWYYHLYVTIYPAAPTNLTAAAASETQINLSWADNSSNPAETSFRIERSPNGTSGWTEIGTGPANSTTYSDTGLTCGATYYYRVRARDNDNDDSTYSNTANATLTCTLPNAPSGLTATAVSQTQINLSWTDNSTNETGFHIERSPDGATWAEIATVGANATTYSNTGLTCGTQYYYRVRANRSGVGYSGYSNTANATTQACNTPTPTPTGTILPTSTGVPTPTLTPTPDMGNPPDIAEPNNDFYNSFRLAPGNSINLNFNSGIYGVEDVDFFAMTVKEGVTYTCETSDLGIGTDTILATYGPSTSFDNQLCYNDDIDSLKGNVASRVTWKSEYNGQAYIVVRQNGPLAVPGLATYTLTCYTGQPKTSLPSGSGGGGGGAPAAPGPKSAVKIEIVDVPTRVPVPTAAPLGTLTVYIVIAYDENANSITDLSEGVMGMSVRAINTRDNTQLASGFTNQSGNLQLIVTAQQDSDVMIVVPYLSIGKIFRVGQIAEWKVLLPAANLPGLIP